MFSPVIEDEIAHIKAANASTKEFILDPEHLRRLAVVAKTDDSVVEHIWRCHLLFLSKYISKSKYTDDAAECLTPDEALSMSWESLLAAIKSYGGESSFSHWFLNKFRIDLNSEWRRRCKRVEHEQQFVDDELEFDDVDDGYLEIDRHGDSD